jgi:hypothetical protein
VIDREERVAELKAEVNELRTRLGLPPRYQTGGATTISGPAPVGTPAPPTPSDPDTST